MSELPDRQDLLQKFGGVERVMDRIVGAYLDAAPGHIEKIGAAIEASDSAALSQCAHAFKGSLGYFTQGRLYELVKDIEALGKQERCEEAQRLLPEVREKCLALSNHLSEIRRV